MTSAMATTIPQISDLIGWMRSRLFGAIFLSSLPNDNMKFSFSRFWEECKLSAVTLSFPLNENHLGQASKSALHLFCTTRPTNLMQSSISMIHFGCSSCHSFFNSLIMYQAYWKLAQFSSPNTQSIYITYIDTSIICGLIINPHNYQSPVGLISQLVDHCPGFESHSEFFRHFFGYYWYLSSA